MSTNRGGRQQPRLYCDRYQRYEGVRWAFQCARLRTPVKDLAQASQVRPLPLVRNTLHVRSRASADAPSVRLRWIDEDPSHKSAAVVPPAVAPVHPVRARCPRAVAHVRPGGCLFPV